MYYKQKDSYVNWISGRYLGRNLARSQDEASLGIFGFASTGWVETNLVEWYWSSR